MRDNNGPEMPSALGHLIAIDLSESIGGQYCGRLLADFGARVTVVEPPGGSPIRRLPPRAKNTSDSLVFRHLNAGKDSRVIDWRTADGWGHLAALVAVSDVVILPPGEDAGRFTAMNPKAIVARVDDFAPGTPMTQWQGPEMVIQALSGMMHNNGALGREPLYGTGSRSAYAAGLAAYIGILTALYARTSAGGQTVMIDRAETAASMAFPYVMQFLYSGHDRTRAELSIPAGQVLCRDGWVCIWIYNFRWRALCEALELTELIEDSRFADPVTRRKNWDELFRIIQEKVGNRDAEGVVDALQTAQVIAAKAPVLAELHADRHLAARHYWEDDGQGRMLGPPFRMSRTPRAALRPAPSLDASAFESAAE